MTRKKILVLLLFVCCSFILKAQQHFAPGSLKMQWQLLKNPDGHDPLFHCLITFINKGEQNIPLTGWKIYFNLRYHGYSITSQTPAFEIKHVTGELFYIEPTPGRGSLNKGQSITIEYTGTGRIANYQDVPSGLFWVEDRAPGVGIALPQLSPVKGQQFEADATAAFNRNSETQDIPASKLPGIFPETQEYQELPGTFLLNRNTTIYTDAGFMREAIYLAGEIKKLTGKMPAINGLGKRVNVIILKKGDLKAEAYQLDIKPGTIDIIASGGAGIFYGIQSLKSLLPAKAWAFAHTSLQIPSVAVNDAPRFPHREFMLDVSRNFQPKQEILRILDLMSLYKLNVFHFHLTDDEGWRLAIPGLPELTDIGAKRGYPFNNNHQLAPAYGSGPDAAHSPGTGYYSKNDFLEILKYASVRHIQVIPEIESPGHARAAVIAMGARYDKYMKAGNKGEAEKYLLYDPQDKSRYMSNQGFNDNVMNVALPSTYTFMEKVIDEIKVMYREAGAPLAMLHVGGDEVPEGSWEKSPVVLKLMKKDSSVKNTKDLWRNYFQKIESMLKARGIAMNGWEELAKGTQTTDNSEKIIVNPGFIRDSIQMDAWWGIIGKQDAAYELANAGYKVVLCPIDYFYFDLANSKSFDEPGDAWIGYLDAQKVYSFSPYNYYRNTKADFEGKPLPKDYFKSKEPLTQAGKANIVGLQAAMWQENIGTPKLLEYMLLPRLLAMAGRAWEKEPAWAAEAGSVNSEEAWLHDCSVFVNVLAKKELPRLTFYNGGYNYRIPAASATIKNGKVFANCGLPGFIIRYTTDGSAPTVKSNIYNNSVPIKGDIKLSVFNSTGRHGKVTGIINK